MELTSLFQQLGIALGLGLLVGLQRERVASRLAGVRTFPLITILGTVCALLAQTFGGWIIALGLVALAGLIVVGKLATLKEGPPDPGLTTEVAMLLMFSVGAYLVIGHRTIAIAIGGGVAVLLQFKGQLHGIVERLGENDLKAIMQFALISLVILPVLPDHTYGPFAVLNPRNIWWMVVLIVGLSLSGYIIYKFFGEQAGLVLGGILGRRHLQHRDDGQLCQTHGPSAGEQRPLRQVTIMIASTVVFARLMLEIVTVAPSFWTAAGPPLLGMLVLFALLSAALWLGDRNKPHQMPEQENPSQLKSALLFGPALWLGAFGGGGSEGTLRLPGIVRRGGAIGLDRWLTRSRSPLRNWSKRAA